jgi:hypothetical protein
MVRVWRPALLGLAVLVGIAGIYSGLLYFRLDPLSDVAAYYRAAERLDHGLPLYPRDADPDLAAFYRYPPLLAVVLRPVVAIVPFEVFRVAWGLAMAACLGLLVRRVGTGYRTWVALGLLGIGVGFALAVGQAQLLVTLLVALGTPWSVALAGQLKVFPALAAVYWLGRRDWPALRRFLGWSAGLLLVQLVLEPAGTLAYPAALLASNRPGGIENWSPWAVSPALWAVLFAVGAAAALRLARTRWGWPAAVALATFSPPRLLLPYMPIGLLAALRSPDPAPAGADTMPPSPGSRSPEG